MNDKQIIKRLTEELEQATKPKWISVDDKWPNECEYVSGEYEVVLIYSEDIGVTCGFIEGSQWCCVNRLPIVGVTHWMHLPESPQQ